MQEVDHAVLRIARSQHGLVTRAQVLAAGGDGSLIRRRVEMGWWERVERGVYRLAGAPASWEARLLAVCLAGGAVASHRIAAVLHGVEGFRPGALEVTVPRRVRLRRDGVRVHQSTDLELARIVRCRGVPTTDVNRLLVDVGAVLPMERVEAIVDDLLVRRLTTWDRILESLLRHARKGRRGVGALRALLEARYGDGEIPLSRWSRIAERLLVDAGLPRPALEYRVFDGRRFVAQIDLAWPRYLVGVELDSRRHHLNAEAFERDPVRRNELEILGWRILNVTWRRMVEQPGAVCDQVARALGH